MTEESKARMTEQIKLFVCSEGEVCCQAVTFMQGWANGCPDIETEIVPIAGQPAQVVRLGITHTPALVINGELIAQNLSINSLAELLRLRRPGRDAVPQLSG
jgi:hypothetical protein